MLNRVFRSAARLAPLPLPGPEPLPLLGYRGNLLKLMHDPLGSLRRMWRQYGNFAAVTANDPSFVCAFGPDHNRQIFSNDALFEQYFTVLPTPENSALARVTRSALVVNGSEHRRQRRVMSPPFQRRRTADYREGMVKVAERALFAFQPGQTLELTLALRHLTLGTILHLVFGVDPTENPALFQRAERLLGEFLRRLGSKTAILFPMDVPRSPYRQLLRQGDKVEHLVFELLQLTQEAQGGSSIPVQLDGLNRAEGSTDPAGDLVGQLVTLLLAGQETTNNALAWTLFLLAQHPHVLGELYEELWAQLYGEAPTLQQLEQLPLLDHVVKEALRLLPPAANGARRTKRPVQLGQYELPAGSVVIFSEYISHHLPEVFTNPEQFLPRRWEALNPSYFEYFPFGAGARSCLGSHFALLEMKLAVSLLVQRAWPEVVPGLRIDFELKPALAPRKGIRVLLKRPKHRLRLARVTGQIHDAVDLTHVS